MKAADVMTTEVIGVSPETEISEVARLLLEHRVSAVPVIDRDGRILGMVSEGDFDAPGRMRPRPKLVAIPHRGQDKRLHTHLWNAGSGCNDPRRCLYR